MKENERKKRILISLLLCFAYIAAYLVLFAVRRYFLDGEEVRLFGEGLLSPDAELYLSVADNTLATGHFIQTARPAELGLVVPFGVPAILTLFRALGLSVTAIQIVHCLLFGMSCLLLRGTERDMFPRRRWALSPWIYTVAIAIGNICPGSIYVEHYFLACLCVLLRLLSVREMEAERRLGWMNLFSFAAFAVRPVLAPIWIGVLAFTLYAAATRRVGLRLVLWAAIVPAAVLGVNTFVNFRETGQLILMESYSGRDMYIALNPKATSGMMPVVRRIKYTVEEIYEQTITSGLPVWEQSRILRGSAMEFVRTQPLRALGLVAARYVRMFLVFLLGLPVFAIAGAWVAVRRDASLRTQILIQTGSSLLLSLITAWGNFVGRYTVVIFPVMALHLSVLAELALARLLPRWFAPERVETR